MIELKQIYDRLKSKEKCITKVIERISLAKFYFDNQYNKNIQILLSSLALTKLTKNLTQQQIYFYLQKLTSS